MKIALAIVGNGAAAAEAILALRASGCDDEIHLFADNDHAPYNPMLGTYLVAQSIPPEQAFPFGDDRFYQINRVEAHLGQTVEHLDAVEQVLTTADGSLYRYDRCLVASGARPSVPPIPGLREALAATSDRRVFTIQSFQDALALKEAVSRLPTGSRSGAGDRDQQRLSAAPSPTRRPRAAVIGASFAGLKIAAVLHELGLQVCLVEREPQILPLSAHPESAHLMETHLLEEGYELRLGAALTGIEVTDGGVSLRFGALPGTADPGGADGTACEESATEQAVDLVVVCTGSRPALSFLAPGQVDVSDGILVDERMCSSIDTLYAAGDVAQGMNLLSGRHEIIGLWVSARLQGRAAGRSLAGAPSAYRGSVPHNITHVGKMLFASIGCLDDYDSVSTNTEADAFRVCVWKEGRLAGVNLLNCCLSAGAVKHALLRAATGAVSDTEATWTSFSG
jgi:NADPH-dependent 2,4-dienoyl-CoA reductase/sulfur reductase-like enzyme